MGNKITVFGMLFSLLHANEKRITNTNLFFMLFDFLDPDELMVGDLDQWVRNFKGRELRKDIPQQFEKLFNTEKYNDIFSKKYLPRVRDKAKLLGDLRDFLHFYSPAENVITLFDQYEIEHLPSFLTGILYMVVTGNYDLPYLKELEKDFISAKYVSNTEKDGFRENLWIASQQNFFVSHRKGNRFANLNIIKSLLPNGYVEPDLESFHFECAKNTIKNIDDICKQSNDNMAIIGEGGIGKTTFLQVVMEKSFGKEENPHLYDSSKVIPFFIELNRCPLNIGDWHDNRYVKTNFITRQIADMIQATNFRYRDYANLLEDIESEFRYASNAQKTYLLLLDGFNEITTEKDDNGISVRSTISHEISELNKLPNVRIITTSRLTKSATYAKDFTKVYLTGLNENEIKNHLSAHGYIADQIAQIIANKNLMKCLSIPLFLCMFSVENKNMSKECMPDSYGEILYQFFHKTGSCYSLKKRSEDARTNPYRKAPFVTELILEFILPHIGWHMVHADKFSLSKVELEECIENGLGELYKFANKLTRVDMSSFEYSQDNLFTAIGKIGFPSKLDTEGITTCVRDYLCILYSYNSHSTTVTDPSRFSFVHHHIRDYFSAVYAINLIRLLPSVREKNIDSIPLVLRSTYWNKYEAETIGQILKEHHNSPQQNPKTGNWELPANHESDDFLLTSILDFLRGNDLHLDILLQNVINTLNLCRGELSGLCFDRLDLRNCNIYNMTCSKKGKTRVLAASFRSTDISDYTFSLIEPHEPVKTFLYADGICVTSENGSEIKVWDVNSGVIIKDLQVHLPTNRGITKERLMVSPNGKCIVLNMCLKDVPVQNRYLWTYGAGFRDKAYGTDERNISLPIPQDTIISMQFSPDSQRLCLLTSLNRYYAIQLNSPSVTFSECLFDVPHTYFEIFPTNWANTTYILAYDDDLTQEDMDETGIPCFLYRVTPSTGVHEIVFTFHSAPEKIPVICYAPTSDCFVCYNHEDKSLCLFNCEFGTSTPIFSEIISDHGNQMPDGVYLSHDGKNRMFVMYSDACYEIETSCTGVSRLTERYTPPTLTNDQGDTVSTELSFVTDFAPISNRLLLVDNSGLTYEWHVEETEPTPKYNPCEFLSTALIPDMTRKILILVYKQNGYSVFSQQTLSLIDSRCSSFKDYQVESADYSNQLGLLILLHKRGNHRIVESIGIDAGESTILSSEVQTDVSAAKLSISSDGNHLLIMTSQKCSCHILSDKAEKTIYYAESNEFLADAYFDGNEIHVGISSTESMEKCRCEIYAPTKNGDYKFKSGYYMPYLAQELAQGFIRSAFDASTKCRAGSQKGNEYWISRGFTSKYIIFAARLHSVIEFTKKGNRIVPNTSPKKLRDFDIIMVTHDTSWSELKTTYSYTHYNHTESLIIYKNTQAEFLLDRQFARSSQITFETLTAPAFLKHLLFADFTCILNEVVAVMVDSGTMTLINLDTGEHKGGKFLLPGLAICGCDFRKANFIESNFVSRCGQIAEENGGIVRDPYNVIH